MKQFNIRPLDAGEILVRIDDVQQETDAAGRRTAYARVRLYKDARVDMRILDELVSPWGWKRRHDIINGKNYCTVSLFNSETGQWVDKQDVGVEQNFEREKSEASDAFKRACTLWGIGRELYTTKGPLRIPLRNDEVWSKNGGATLTTSARFRVGEVRYDDHKRITFLSFVDKDGVVRATYQAAGTQTAPQPPVQQRPAPQPPRDPRARQAMPTVSAMKNPGGYRAPRQVLQAPVQNPNAA